MAKKYHGMSAGEENGIRGYFLTYVIAYIRDFVAHYYFVAESFETACPWDKVSDLCINVKKRLILACAKRGIPEEMIFGTNRIT
jgi:alkyldihydroxyacetonephosphate synthase